MSTDTRRLDIGAVRRLEKLWQPFGNRNRFAGRVAAVANSTSKPTSEQVATQARMLGRIVGDRKVTTRSLQLIGRALGKNLEELEAVLLADSGDPSEGIHAQEVKRGASPVWLWPATETGRLFRRLGKASQLTSSRMNVVRDEAGTPTITLDNQLYVRRDVQDNIERALQGRSSEARFIVIEGEAGTGKSTILWAMERALKEEHADVWLIDAIELVSIFGQGRDGTILSESFRDLFRNMIAEGRAPIFLIDTVDALLNTRGMDTYLVSLLTELAIAEERRRHVRWSASVPTSAPP